ncbi:NmrA-like family protein [Phlyctema vagabunda]|uniref:NmrA-like family protein n=1 Tax=Phlyctema vagabunda TaxID=108571 RepID=A0ABR4P8N6_9HELO
MSRVAIIGGSSGLGRSITEQIAATKKHVVFVLSRKVNHKSTTRGPRQVLYLYQSDITVKVVDYSSPHSIAEVLRSNNIDTVISTMGVHSDEHFQSQLNAIEGAVESGTVKRFAPSEFAADNAEAVRRNYPLPSSVYKTDTVAKLRETPLEYTRFINGCFLDYFGHPHAPTYLPMFAVGLDVENGVAAIPGDGNSKVAFTYSKDIGDYVAAALDLDVWPEASFIAGDKVTFNEMLAIAEKTRGVSFKVSYDSVASLKAGRSTELPANIPRYAFFPKAQLDAILQGFGLNMADGFLNFPDTNLAELLPQVKPLTVQAFFDRFWA